MLKKMLALAILLVMTSVVHAQTSYSVVLTWKASTSSTTTAPGAVKVLRATGACPSSGIGTLTYNSLNNTAPAAGPYTDSTVALGTTYCYYLEQVEGTATSGPSNTFQAAIPSTVTPPSTLGGTVTTVTVTTTVTTK